MRRTELVAKARRVVGLSPHSETSSAPVIDTHTRVGSKRKSQDMDTEGEVDRTVEAVAETTTALSAVAETVTQYLWQFRNCHRYCGFSRRFVQISFSFQFHFSDEISENYPDYGSRTQSRQQYVFCLTSDQVVAERGGQEVDRLQNLRLDPFDGFPQVVLDHLPIKILNSLTCTGSLGDLFKTRLLDLHHEKT